MAERGEGNAIRFIRQHQSYPHEEWCVIWPFSTTRGYGTFGYLGKSYYAHRFMCELAHGAPPSGIHEAAHSCGDSACVNPRHLSWKTPTENGLDSRKHGTHVRSRYGNGGKITAEQAETIRQMKDVKTLRELADEFRVSESCISNIWVGKTHFRPRKILNWTPEEDSRLRAGIARGLNFTELAKLFPARQPKGVVGRVYRIGLKSGQSVSPSERETP